MLVLLYNWFDIFESAETWQCSKKRRNFKQWFRQRVKTTPEDII